MSRICCTVCTAASTASTVTLLSGTASEDSTALTSPIAWASNPSSMLPEVSTTTATAGTGRRNAGTIAAPTACWRREIFEYV